MSLAWIIHVVAKLVSGKNLVRLLHNHLRAQVIDHWSLGLAVYSRHINFLGIIQVSEEITSIMTNLTVENKTKFWSVQLGKPLDFGLLFGPPPCYCFSLLLCLEPCKKFSVGGGWWWLTVNLVFCFGPKLKFWTWTKLNNCNNNLYLIAWTGTNCNVASRAWRTSVRLMLSFWSVQSVIYIYGP